MRSGRKPPENPARIFSISTPGRIKSGPKNGPGFRSQNWDRNPALEFVFAYKLINRGLNFGTGIRARFWDRILFGGAWFRCQFLVRNQGSFRWPGSVRFVLKSGQAKNVCDNC